MGYRDPTKNIDSQAVRRDLQYAQVTFYDADKLAAGITTNLFRKTVAAIFNAGSAGKCKPNVLPPELIQALIEKTALFEFRVGIENALSAKLEAALASLEADRPSSIQQLEAFINQVEALRGRVASDAEADELTADAREVIAAIQAL